MSFCYFYSFSFFAWDRIPVLSIQWVLVDNLHAHLYISYQYKIHQTKYLFLHILLNLVFIFGKWGSFLYADCRKQALFNPFAAPRPPHVAIGIPLLPPTLYAGVKQHRPWSVLGWVTVVVCQFLLIVLRMRL